MPIEIPDTDRTRLAGVLHFPNALVICPIAIAYSMGQIIKSVCVCVSVCVSVCLCVCPSASTLTVAFLDRLSPKLAQT